MTAEPHRLAPAPPLPPKRLEAAVKPTGLFMITEDGLRVPIDLKLAEHCDPDDEVTFWEPVIEADLNTLMPRVIGFGGAPLTKRQAIHFPNPGPGWDTVEWAERIMANSRQVFTWYDYAGLGML